MPGRHARIGKGYVIVERPANLAANRVHTLAVFRNGETEGERFRLDPSRALFMMTDQRPKGWQVRIWRDDPVGWWSDFMRALHAALAAARAHSQQSGQSAHE